MNPNILRLKYHSKDQNNNIKMPEKIQDICPISLACMKYQNNALNFIIKFNSTLREILNLNNKVQSMSMNSRVQLKDPYHVLINQLENSK
jgi:hypothetical protein